MKPGDVALCRLQQADGARKLRPTIVLAEMPPYGDLLVCAISTQLHHQVSGFDDVIRRGDDDFEQSGLLATSLIRLGFLSVIAGHDVAGGIGAISRQRHNRLIRSLCAYLGRFAA